MIIAIKEKFKKDFITREAGETLRLLIKEAFRKKENLVLDFTGIMIASSSFFDEGIAKLQEEGFGALDLEKIKFVGLHPRDKEILDVMVGKRKLKSY